MTIPKAIHVNAVPKAAIERDENVYLADGTYFADGTIDGSGGAVIPSRVARAVVSVNEPQKIVKE